MVLRHQLSMSSMDEYSWAIPLMKHGSHWRNGRRLLHEFLSARAVTNFDGCQRKHAYRFCLRLTESPESFLDHAKLWVSSPLLVVNLIPYTISSVVAALVMEIAYGVDIVSNDNQFLAASAGASEIAKRASIPGAFLVNAVPICVSTMPPNIIQFAYH